MVSSFDDANRVIILFGGFIICGLLTIFLIWLYKRCHERRLQNRRRANRANFVRFQNVNGTVPQLHFERGNNA